VTPPVALRLQLETLRARGYTFGQAWPIAMRVALQDQSLMTTIWWRSVFVEQRQQWAVSYSRAPWPSHKRPGLEPAGTYEGEAKDPTATYGLVVA
jgi:hypothetical protein